MAGGGVSFFSQISNRRRSESVPEPLFSRVSSPAARRRGGRLSGEVPVLARRDPGLPAGQEGRGQGSQQVAVVHAARGAVGGGLRTDQLAEAELQRDE